MQLNPLALIEKLNRQSSAELIADAMAAAFEQCGLDKMIITSFEPTLRSDMAILATSPNTSKLLQVYTARNFFPYCPVFQIAKHSLEPFSWTIESVRRESYPRTKEIVHAWEQHGVREGFMVSIRGPYGLDARVGLGGTSLEVASKNLPAIRLIALYGFNRLRSIVNRRSGSTLRLSEREKDVLSWSARGRSASETAELMGIAKRTVDQHAANACRRLGASNRMQAVAIAVRDHLIEL